MYFCILKSVKCEWEKVKNRVVTKINYTNTMEVFLLAAGLGTRLRPLTNDRPKALVEVEGRSLLEINIDNLIRQGATRIVVNVHHFADKIITFLNSRTWDAEILISDERELLLDTGGGLKKAEPLFSGTQPILIHNVDILSRLDLSAITQSLMQSQALATLAVSDRSTSRKLLFDPDGKLIGWHNLNSGEYLWADAQHSSYKELAFSGIAVVKPQLLTMLPPANAPYPIIPAYLEIAQQHRIDCYPHDPKHWLDVGKPETLKIAHEYLPI